MRRFLCSLLLLSGLSAPVAAQEVLRPVQQIALLHLDNAPHTDIDQLMSTHWRDYYLTSADNAFTQRDLRCGQVDLDGDGVPELVVMIDRDGWQGPDGMPMVVAQWRKKTWVAIGWGWGDDETLFSTNEVLGGWRSLDAGTQWLRWNGVEYTPQAKED